MKSPNMKSPNCATLLSASLLPAAICLAALVLFQLPKPDATTALAHSQTAQSIEAARDTLERAVHDARVNPSGESTAAVRAAFQNYLAVASSEVSKILNRIRELKSLLGMADSTSSADASANAQRLKSDAKADELRNEYRELSARLAILRSDFGAALVDVNKSVGSQGRGASPASAAECHSLIINGESTTSDPDITTDATLTLLSVVIDNTDTGSISLLDQLPASLDGVDVIYDIRFSSALSASDASAYLSFLQRGGKLLLVGENASFEERNQSIISFLSTAGGGFAVPCERVCQCSAFCLNGTGTLCSTPNSVSTIFLPVPGGIVGGNGNPLLTVGGSCTQASIYPSGRLTNAPAGTLITIFDINMFQTTFSFGNDNLKLLCNIAAFFCNSSSGSCAFGGCILICPPDINVAAASTCLPAAGAVVNYPLPQTFGNCGTVTCSPPSGSFFPNGSTAVFCTTSSGFDCSFAVTVSGGCLQDETNPNNVVVFNPRTGEYRFCCDNIAFTGVGTVTVKGCNVTIQHNTEFNRVLIKFNGSLKSGSASFQTHTGSIKCTITDRNTADSSCGCR